MEENIYAERYNGVCITYPHRASRDTPTPPSHPLRTRALVVLEIWSGRLHPCSPQAERLMHQPRTRACMAVDMAHGKAKIQRYNSTHEGKRSEGMLCVL
jgi:hypothetical protein